MQKKSRSKQVLPTDKVLSVRQLFAQLLVTPSKTIPSLPMKWIENRTWEPSLPRGASPWLLIHASGTIDDPSSYREHGFRLEDCQHGAIIGFAELIGWKRLRFTDHSKEKFVSKKNDSSRHDDWLKFRFSQIADDDAVWSQHCTEIQNIVEQQMGDRPNFGIDQIERKTRTVHRIFTEPKLLDEPIACAGKLRIWTLPIG